MHLFCSSVCAQIINNFSGNIDYIKKTASGNDTWLMGMSYNPAPIRIMIPDRILSGGKPVPDVDPDEPFHL